MEAQMESHERCENWKEKFATMLSCSMFVVIRRFNRHLPLSLALSTHTAPMGMIELHSVQDTRPSTAIFIFFLVNKTYWYSCLPFRLYECPRDIKTFVARNNFLSLLNMLQDYLPFFKKKYVLVFRLNFWFQILFFSLMKNLKTSESHFENSGIPKQGLTDLCPEEV